MTIALEVSGKPFINWTSVGVEFSLDKLARVFSFSAVSSEAETIPFNIGQPCRVLIDGEPVLTGHIEKLNIAYDSESHEIEVSGRDRLGDLVDSTMEPLEIQGDISLRDVIRRVLDQIGLNDVEIINQAGGIANFNKAEDVLSADPGENAWEFVEQVARKRQVLLRTDESGNIIIFRADTPTKNTSRLLNEIRNNQNNILAASVSRDETEVFERYIVRSGLNVVPLNFGGIISAADIVDNKGEVSVAKTNAIRATRQMVLQAENASSKDQCKARADWEANFRQSRQFVYSATLNGFRDASGALWDANQLLEVRDQLAGLTASEPLLVNSVSFRFDEMTGRQTTLGMITPESYKNQIQKPETTKKVAKDEPLVFK